MEQRIYPLRKKTGASFRRIRVLPVLVHGGFDPFPRLYDQLGKVNLTTSHFRIPVQGWRAVRAERTGNDSDVKRISRGHAIRPQNGIQPEREADSPQYRQNITYLLFRAIANKAQGA